MQVECKKCGGGDQWCRANVMSTTKDVIAVLYVDTGNTGMLWLADFRNDCWRVVRDLAPSDAQTE